MITLRLTLILHFDHRLVVLPTHDLERPVLQVRLDSRVLELPPNEALCIKDCTCWVSSGLVLCRVTYETFLVSEGNEGRCRAFALCVGDDLHTIVLKDAHARVRCS
mmetsp:Transcript_17642/g.47683  ORF Transcript_17642/g.47683 Transcript_17642/m.47683 type:complete len:106 (-) Transcript_17642:238-555(-)